MSASMKHPCLESISTRARPKKCFLHFDRFHVHSKASKCRPALLAFQRPLLCPINTRMQQGSSQRQNNCPRIKIPKSHVFLAKQQKELTRSVPSYPFLRFQCCFAPLFFKRPLPRLKFVSCFPQPCLVRSCRVHTRRRLSHLLNDKNRISFVQV